jgi:hypothetical protein
MESIRAPEVRCPRCNCSFAPETRVCIHCGGRLGTRLLLRGPVGPEPTGELVPGEVEVPAELSGPRGVVGQIAVGLLSVALMGGLALLRACQER